MGMILTFYCSRLLLAISNQCLSLKETNCKKRYGVLTLLYDSSANDLRAMHAALLYRLQLEWSVLGFSQSHYVVCEDAGLLAVRIQRTGALNHSSTVTVRVRSMSAKEASDFTAKSSLVVEFLPGQ